MIDNIARWDAAYVLGALSHKDRYTYETYLASNPERSAALTELAGLPGVLSLLSRSEAVALTEQAGDAAADLMPSLAIAAATRQRRSRRRLAVMGVVAAATIAVGAGAVGATAFPRPGPPPVAEAALHAMQPTPKGGISAALAVTEKRWGTRLDWTCEYTKDWAKSAASYDIVVTTVEGVESAVGTWSPASDHGDGLAASTAIPTGKIRTVDIRLSGTHEPLAISTMA